MLKEGKDLDLVLSGLKKTLEKKGHQELNSSVLAGVLRVIESKSIDESIVTVASAESYKKQAAAIAAALKDLEASGEPKVKVDETIIGGFIAEANNTRHDASYKTKLVNLYRSLTQ